MVSMSVTPEQVTAALTKVLDPEIRLPITELGMVREVQVDGGQVTVMIDLTVPGCPMKDTIRGDVINAVAALDGVEEVVVELGVMTDEQREQLKHKLQGQAPDIPFARPDSRTHVYAVTSGKGGVGKSTVTANLAIALAKKGFNVGVVDADVYGFSIPQMLGVDQAPTQVSNMIMPPVVHGVKVISMGMFVPPGQPVVWRGPILHRAVQQFLSEVFWGDLDVLLLDLPPGTGDIALSVSQLVPTSQILLITTPQSVAAEVAERAGQMAVLTQQRIVGVVENMSWLELPDGNRVEVFGAGGGAQVADRLSEATGAPVQLLGQIPLDVAVREGSDTGAPVVLNAPESSGARALMAIAETLVPRRGDLAGMHLGVTPV